MPLPNSYLHIGNPRLEDMLQFGYVEYVPTPYSATREEMWQQIKAERERRKSGGVLVEGKWFHTDPDSRIQHIGLTIMGAGIPAGLMWKTMDGTFIAMTQTLAGQIFQAVALADQHNFANAETHRMITEALLDLNNYDFSSGWMPVYEPET